MLEARGRVVRLVRALGATILAVVVCFGVLEAFLRAFHHQMLPQALSNEIASGYHSGWETMRFVAAPADAGEVEYFDRAARVDRGGPASVLHGSYAARAISVLVRLIQRDLVAARVVADWVTAHETPNTFTPVAAPHDVQ